MIRPATEFDLPRLLAMGQKMHASTWYSFMRFDAAKLEQTLRICMATGFLWVHESDGAVDGGMVGLLAEQWFGPDKTACDLALFVEPDKRGGMAAYRLVNQFLIWAAEAGASEVTLGVSTGTGAEAMYERMELTRVGALYKMRLGATQAAA